MDVLGSALYVLQNEALAQNRLANDVNALATGLRVRSAVDDPSGYAIAATIQTKASGLQESVQNVQTANNLLSVADGALSSVQLLLQRIRSLTVEANSDINSTNDLENIQTEIDSLLSEINKITSEVNFNGQILFNGQFAQGTGVASNNLTVQLVTPPFPNAQGATGSNSLAAGQNFISLFASNNYNVAINGGGGYVPALTVFTIVSASNNMIDPDTQTDVGPGVLIQEVVYSQAGSTLFGPQPLYVDYSAVPYNTPLNGIPIGTPGEANAPPTNDNLLLTVNIAGLNANDVGAQFAVFTQLPDTPANGHSLTVNDGGDEGTTVSINLPEISTATLKISGISVLPPGLSTVDPIQTLANSGIATSNNMPASAAELAIDNALNAVTSIRAALGAQWDATQEDVNNDQNTIVNETASYSNIRDADIGATATDLTKEQILVNVGDSVLAQLQVSTQQLTALLLNSFTGTVVPGGAAGGGP